MDAEPSGAGWVDEPQPQPRASEPQPVSGDPDLRVEQACRKIQARLDGLRPYVVEFNLLRVALMGIESRMPAAPDRPRSRSEQAFAAIFLDPGLTTQEIADDSGIALSSLYPVLRGLEDQGLAHRISRCWYPGPRDPGSTSLLGLTSP